MPIIVDEESGQEEATLFRRHVLGGKDMDGSAVFHKETRGIYGLIRM